jgi:hypothetical protein
MGARRVFQLWRYVSGSASLAVSGCQTRRRDELRAHGIEQAARFRWDTEAAEMEEMFREALGR